MCRFGSNLNSHIHFHVIVTDGVDGYVIKPIDTALLSETIARQVLARATI